MYCCDICLDAAVYCLCDQTKLRMRVLWQACMRSNARADQVGRMYACMSKRSNTWLIIDEVPCLLLQYSQQSSHFNSAAT